MGRPLRLPHLCIAGQVSNIPHRVLENGSGVRRLAYEVWDEEHHLHIMCPKTYERRNNQGPEHVRACSMNPL